MGDAHLFEQARYSQVANREALPAGLVTQGARQPGLATTGRPGNAQVQGLADPVTAGQSCHAGALQPSRVAVIDVFNTGRHAQTGGPEQPLQSPVFAVQHFAIHQQGQAFLERQVVGFGLSPLLFQSIAHARQFELAQGVECVLSQHQSLRDQW